MENKFKHLRIENKPHLPEPWYNYPVLAEGFETIVVYLKDREDIKVRIGIQDGVWTAGYSFHIGDSGGSRNPGRKWGEFASKDDAILYVLGEVEANLKLQRKRPVAALNALEREIKKVRFDKLQLSLF